MNAIGIKEDKVKKFTKKNVNNEAEDYLEEEAQVTEELERPQKRSRHWPHNGQTSSNTSNSSMHGTLKSCGKDEISKGHLGNPHGPKGLVESTQHNVKKKKTKPHAVTSQSPGSSNGHNPISSKSFVHHDHGSADPRESTINRNQDSTQFSCDLSSPSHPMKLRDSVRRAASLQTSTRKKKLVPNILTNAVPHEGLKVDRSFLLSSKKNKSANHALVKPKVTSNGRDSLCKSRESAAIQSFWKKGTADGTATLKESTNNGGLDKIISGECSSSLEIASSASGEVKISLQYNLAPGRSEIHALTLENVLKSVEDEHLKAPKSWEPKVSLMSLMKEICEHFLKLGTDLNGQSLLTESPSTINSMSKYSKADFGYLSSGAKLPGPYSIVPNPPCNGINGGQQLDKLDDCNKPELTGQPDVYDISKGHENVVITLVNEVNDEPPPSFCYIPQNSVFQNAYMNDSLARTGDNNCCETCTGDCLSLSVPCACSFETGGEFAYTADGLVKEELLNECISMNRYPDKHCQVFCNKCPLERSKCEDIYEPCKGHLVRKFIKECWRKCGCNKQCGNRVVQRGITRKLQVFMTKRKGWGLRTLEDLPKGAFVCEYVGEVLTNAELFERGLRIPEGHKVSYPVLLDADWCAEGVLEDEEALCLDATYYGNVARFINHKCHDSNLVEIPVEVETPDHHYYHLAFFTTRKVKALEELTWDYGIDFDDHVHPIKAFRCQCGSKFCRNMKRRSRCRR